MGRLKRGNSSNPDNQHQQSNQIQPESNTQNEVEQNQNHHQQTVFPPSHAHTARLPPVSQQTTSFSTGNAQSTTAFSPANTQSTTAFSEGNPQSRPSPAFFSPPNNAQHHHAPHCQNSGACQDPSGYEHAGQQVPSNEQYPTPAHGIPIRIQYQAWSTGLFDCLDDPLNALVTMFLPCATYGQIAHILDHGQSSCLSHMVMYICILHFTGLTCLVTWPKRTKMRKQYSLLESPAPDCLVHLFCEFCALCQEYRELHNRGIDPSIGWDENVNRGHIQMMPPMNQRIVR